MGKIVVAFDLYGTLLCTTSIAKDFEKVYGKNTAQSIAKTWRRYQLEYTWRLNSMSSRTTPDIETCLMTSGKYQDFATITEKSLIHALREHDIKVRASTVEEVLEAYDRLSAFDDVALTLERLRQISDAETVIFSNGTRRMIESSVAENAVLSAFNFTHLLSVEFVQRFKPAPEAYKYLTRCVDKVNEPSDVWLISANAFDIMGARSAGLKAIWVDRAGTGWHDQLGDGPTLMVKSLDEVVAAVEDHARK